MRGQRSLPPTARNRWFQCSLVVGQKQSENLREVFLLNSSVIYLMDITTLLTVVRFYAKICFQIPFRQQWDLALHEFDEFVSGQCVCAKTSAAKVFSKWQMICPWLVYDR